MKELGVSFHCGSGKNAIRSEKDLKSIDEHNNRKYKNKNNQELNPALSHENVILVGSRYIVEDIKKVYKDEFSEAVYNYNMKQKREDRKILDYYTKINNDKQTNLACEMLFQFGDYDHWKDKTLEERKKMTEVFKGVIDVLKDYNIVTAQATIHYDESCPHMHLVGVPISKDNKRGVEKQVSQNKVITLKNLELIREDVEKMFAREYKRVFNEEVAIKHGSELPDHLDVKKYKKAKEILKVAKEYEYNQEIKDTIEKELENTKEEIKEIEEKIIEAENEKENKIEKIENVKKETNNLTNELTNLEEKTYSLNSEVKELETSKKTKEKEKDDIEKELDLYQKKIKDYKEQIEKDKEEAIKLEEDQKKIEEDKKEQEKKNKAVKDEIDKKNKEYNDLLTEKNTLEEKKKKLDEEKQKIDEFYKNMETIITTEKEKMIKDAEEKSKELLKEKDDLENDITKIKEFIITQKSIKNEREKEAEEYKKLKEASEKLQKDKKETEDLIKSLTLEKTRLESEKDELKDIVQKYLEKQKDYNTILTPAFKEIKSEEKKKEIIETVKNTIVNEYDSINIKLEGILDNESRYNKEYKLFVEAIKDNKKVSKEILTPEEKENLAYNLASANYSIYSNNFDKMEINYNTSDGKTKIEVTHDYTTKDKIEFEPTRLDNFIILIKEKVTDFKNAIVDGLKQKFGYPNIEKDNYFNKEQDKKNKDKIDIEY